MPLEDDFCDIIKKARIGQAWSVADVARMTGLSGGDITALERGVRPPDRIEVRALAKALGLRAGPLEQIVLEKWVPQPIPSIPGIETIQGDINGYAVNGYIVHDSGEALLVDTAYNAPAMIAWLESHRLRLTSICLTHGHADHAEGIQEFWGDGKFRFIWGLTMSASCAGSPWRIVLLPRTTDAPSRSGVSASIVSPRRAIPLAGFAIEWMPSHSASVSSAIRCLRDPLAVRIPVRCIRPIWDRSGPACSTLSPGYRLLPGHGPATTVREELDHNPFASDH